MGEQEMARRASVVPRDGMLGSRQVPWGNEEEAEERYEEENEGSSPERGKSE